MEISDDGPRLGSRREIWAAEAAGEEEEEEEEEDGESGHPCCCVRKPRRNIHWGRFDDGGEAMEGVLVSMDIPIV